MYLLMAEKSESQKPASSSKNPSFEPAAYATLSCYDLDGTISECTAYASAAAIAKKDEDRGSNSADATCLDLGWISGSDPKLEVVQCVDLRAKISVMTRYSHDSVAIGYGENAQGIDIIDSGGGKQPYTNIPSDLKKYDFVFQEDMSVCVATTMTVGSRKAHMYSSNGSRKATINVTGAPYIAGLHRSQSDEILVTDYANRVFIYDPTGSTLKHTVKIKQDICILQLSTTRSGLIITSSCFPTMPDVVTVCDRDGNAGNSLPVLGDSDLHDLYVAVDEQDRVYVASVDWEKSNLMIRLYGLDGLNLKERLEFNPLNMTLDDDYLYGCNFVSLSPDLLAFACKNKLYFIKVAM